MEQSILKSTKKMLQIGDDDDSFDLDVLTHINSAFSTLHQIGVGPSDGFAIEDDETEWSAFIPSDSSAFNPVKTYIGLRVRLLFDPPSTSFLLAAMEKQIQEFEWRLNVAAETGVIISTVVIDGGSPDDDEVVIP